MASPLAHAFAAGIYRIEASPSGKIQIIRGSSTLLSAPEAKLRGTASPGLLIEAHGTVHHYKGLVQFSCQKQREHWALLVSNLVERRDYVESVVGSETQPGWPIESLKAIAVLAQTKLARIKPDEDLGDSTQRQAYFGSDYARAETRRAVASVWGKLLRYHGEPIQPFFHSTCAGGTSDGVAVFGNAAKGLVYLHGVECNFCRQSPFWKETITKIPQERFATIFGANLPQVNGYDRCQRPLSVSFEQPVGITRHLSGYLFWTKLGQCFGWDKAPGLRFRLARTGDTITVTSTGAGHGVGLCDWGAAGQAKLGKKYDEILYYYFPGTKVE
jgi:stage II sporulation protein D